MAVIKCIPIFGLRDPKVEKDQRIKQQRNGLSGCFPIFVLFSLLKAMGHSSIPMVANESRGYRDRYCGNYLPKCKQNYKVGIRSPWTLDSETNWNKTHRLLVFLEIGGLIILVNAFFSIWPSMPLLLVFWSSAFVYSYLEYKK
jgi:hypothetical protein